MEKKIETRLNNIVVFPHQSVIKKNGELNLPKEFADRRLIELTEIAMEDIEDTMMDICRMAGYNIQNKDFTHDIAVVTILLKAALHRTSGINDDAIQVLDTLKKRVFPLADEADYDDSEPEPKPPEHLIDDEDS